MTLFLGTSPLRWVKQIPEMHYLTPDQDPYFINGIVDLRYAIECEPSGEKEIRLRTNQKNLLLSADSVPSREEWVKAICKVIFKAQNTGDTVKAGHLQ